MINSLNFTRLCHLQQNDHVTERVPDFELAQPPTLKLCYYDLSDSWHPTMDILHKELYDK